MATHDSAAVPGRPEVFSFTEAETPPGKRGAPHGDEPVEDQQPMTERADSLPAAKTGGIRQHGSHLQRRHGRGAPAGALAPMPDPTPAPAPATPPARWDLELLEQQSEGEMDELVQMASAICGTAISAVSLLNGDRLIIKSAVGVPTGEVPLSVAFCAHAVQQPELFIVEDALDDARFHRNPMVLGDPHVRFYAGMPLCREGDAPVGTLCVVDTVPRILTEGQRNALRILAHQVQTRFELRAQREALRTALAEKSALAERLETSRDTLRAFLDSGPFASYIKDAEGRMVFYNAHLAHRFGVDQQQWLGLMDHEIWPKEIADRHREAELTVLQERKVLESSDTTPPVNGNGTLHWKSYRFPIQDDTGAWMLAGISLDVTEALHREEELKAALEARQSAMREMTISRMLLEQANRKLALQASTDSLTGLVNRRFFDEAAESAFTQAERTGETLAVMLLDVDNFKTRNDRYGHAAGDDALRLLARTLLQISRDRDVAARLGGEELALLMPETSAEQAVAVAAQLQAALAAAPCASGPLTVSIGVAHQEAGDATARSWSRLLGRSDDAMYEAKRAGKNRIVLHRDHLDQLLAKAALGKTG